ncbi:Uma2 family endonuclease [Komarekiella sp. 'clone 1']|uniref:Uma2 family endonuclease n=1 Tax=Komarekiella delphini-convector SJRDD-AB1 TaxID=2593771 RepID=A0AA40VSX3_9NOST|nr:Uma2 family endonuclease [Komarekiella delphini-convector]MBD6618597.1 Uma2 family endonuclease [Komarekiella delphini-convector SJRDD-AB1]
MTQALAKLVTFDEFIQWYPENSEVHYELHDGIIIEMPKPTGEHSDIAGFLIDEFNIAIKELGKRGVWNIPKECVVKPNSDKSGYEPDIIILNRENILQETRWKTESVIEHGSTVKLIVEIASQNWRDDYYKKYSDYEEMGIAEYWIVDHSAKATKKLIGNPKLPTISVYQLIEGEYQLTQFRGNERIVSLTFPNFNLTAEEVFQAGL